MGARVFAYGVRAVEMSLKLPTDNLLDQGKAFFSLPIYMPARRRMLRGTDARIPYYTGFCCDTHDAHSIYCGLAKRLFRVTPTVDLELLAEFEQFVREYVDKHFHQVTPWTYQQWRSTLNFNKVVLRQLDEAHETLVLQGGLPTRQQAAAMTMICKTEWYYPTEKFLRLINSPSEVFKVFSGPMIKTVEEQLYQLPHFIKHMTNAQRVRKIQGLRRDGFYYVTDYTSFEASLGPSFMSVCECVLYTKILGDNVFTRCLNYTLTHNRVLRSRGKVKAVSRGRRMSGDTCTSCGNGFSNLMLALFVAQKSGAECDLLVEGDDGLLSLSKPINESLFKRLGFDIKLARIADPCQALADDGTPQPFCGLLVSTDGQIIRDPGRFFCSIGWVHSFLDASKQIIDSVLRGKAICALFETPDCPIVSTLAWWAYNHTQGLIPRITPDGYHVVPPQGYAPRAPAPSAATRELFARAYNISAELQVAIERAITRGDFWQVYRLMPPPLAIYRYSSCYVRP